MKIDADTQKRIDQARAEGRITEAAFKPFVSPEEAEAEDWKDEKAFMADVRKFAREHSWREYHTTNSKRSPAGFPDCVFVRGCRLIFAELKSDKGKLDPAQIEWLTDLHCVDGIEVYTWRPKDWPEIQRILA